MKGNSFYEDIGPELIKQRYYSARREEIKVGLSAHPTFCHRSQHPSSYSPDLNPIKRLWLLMKAGFN